MRASIFACIVCIVVLLAGSVRGYEGQEVDYKSCESKLGSLKPGEFMSMAAGGSQGCTGKELEGHCCSKIESLFGAEGDLALCMCNREFFSFALESVPGRYGMDADKYLDLLEACNIPFDGKLSCPGIMKERDPQPVVHQQLVGALAIRAISELPISQPQAAPEPPSTPPSSSGLPDGAAGGLPGAAGSFPGAFPGSFGGAGFSGGVPSFPTAVPTFLPETVEQPVITYEEDYGFVDEPAFVEEPAIVPEPVPTLPAPAPAPLPAPAPAPVPAPVEAPAPGPAEPAGCKGIIQTISEVPNLTGFVEAIRAAGLEETLAGEGKVVTVFAPTDEAFTATFTELPVTKEQLFANPELLKSVLEMHIVSGSALRLGDLQDGQELASENGEVITFENDEEIGITAVSVASGVIGEIKLKDVKACDAVVHVIDEVLLPDTPELAAGQVAVNRPGEDEQDAASEPLPDPPATPVAPREPASPVFGQDGCKPIIQEARSRGDLSTFVELIETVGLAGEFGVEFSGTVMVPTNMAFDKFMGELQLTKDILLAESSRKLVSSILKLHALPNRLKSDELTPGKTLTTLLGGEEVLKVESGSQILIKPPGGDSGSITSQDIEACSAIMHIVDTVLIPTPNITSLTKRG